MKYFYSEIVEIESVIVELDELELSTNHKTQLTGLIDSHIHQVVLDIVLSNLDGDDKIEFLARFQSNPEDRELLDYLNQKVSGIDTEIKKAVTELKKELHKDIKDAKRLHPKKGNKP